MSALVARRRRLGGVCVLLLLSFLSPASQAQQEDSTPAEDVAPALAPELEAQLRRLAKGDEEILTLIVVAMDVARAEAWGELSSLLDQGPDRTRVAIVSALRTLQRPELFLQVLRHGAVSADENLRQRAADHLRELAAASEAVFELLLSGFRDGELPSEQLDLIVLALGSSRRLAAVDALLDGLETSREPLARAALMELTGRRPLGTDDSPAAWRAWWEKARWKTREELLEESLLAERERHARALSERDERIVQLELRHMGQDVTRLVAGLESEYPVVRLEAARRLGAHANAEQAALAVPLLMRRLGHEVELGGHDGALEATPTGDIGVVPGASVLEPDPEVRRAAVAALGVLGRDRPEVLDALSQELLSEDLATAQEAVDALARVREAPRLVSPLLDRLERGGLAEATQITALSVIAQNDPQGVAGRLVRWTGPEHAPSVRAAGVRALLIGASPAEALEHVDGLLFGEPPSDVRYAVATGLGAQLRRMQNPDDHGAQLVAMLGRLLDDLDASVRAQAAVSLGDSGQLAALNLLEQHSRVEADVNVMVRVLDAFGSLGVIDAVDTIGRVCSRWSGEGAADLELAARRALQDIGDERPADDWLGMARTVQQVGCFPLAAWCLREGLHRFDTDPSERDVVAQIRGELANVLWQARRPAEAHELLVELHEAQAPYPIASTRLDLLARTSEQLGYDDQAADFYAARLDVLAEGDSTRDENERSLARTLLAAGRPAEALPWIERLLDLDGGDNGLLEDKARAQVALGRDDDARQTYTRLLERLPDDDVETRERVEAARAALATPPAVTDDSVDESRDAG